MRITCDNAFHDAGNGICTFCVEKRIGDAVKAERERIARIADERTRYSPYTPGDKDLGWKAAAHAIGEAIRRSEGS